MREKGIDKYVKAQKTMYTQNTNNNLIAMEFSKGETPDVLF